MREDTAGRVHREKYGKSDKLNAPENQNREFQDGYSTGVDSLGFDARKVIEQEFLLRVEVDEPWQRLRGMESRLLGGALSNGCGRYQKAPRFKL